MLPVISIATSKPEDAIRSSVTVRDCLCGVLEPRDPLNFPHRWTEVDPVDRSEPLDVIDVSHVVKLFYDGVVDLSVLVVDQSSSFVGEATEE